VRISGKVAHSLAAIADKARKVDTFVAEIATASHEQHQGIGQVNTAVGQMDKVTQSNAGNAEETAAAAEELNAQALSLKDAVASLTRLVGGTGIQTSDTEQAARAPRPSAARPARLRTPADRTLQPALAPTPEAEAGAVTPAFKDL